MKGLSPLRKTLLVEGITQEKLAELCGLHRTIISQITTGRVVPTPDERVRIARALAKDETALFEGWKDKIRLSDGGKIDSFLDAIVDYMETLPNDNRRIEACNNIIKVCRNISIELQKGKEAI